MIPFVGAAAGGGGGFSQSGSADTGPVSGTYGGSTFGGINTGKQGVDMTTLAIIGAIVVVALLVLKR